MIRLLPIFCLSFVLAGCSSCADESANADNNDDPTNNIRVEQDAGSGPCQGCFEDDVCRDGKSDTLCGAGGIACTACEGDTSCNDDGECVVPPSCTPETCDGCCTPDDVCVAGDDPTACGNGGARCSACPEGGGCVAGACTFGCGPDNCNGCCDANGECQTGSEDAVCGSGGGVCTDCRPAGAVCAGGACVDSGCAQTCAGCCDGDQCTDPATADACGADGGACVACAAGESCVEGTCTQPDGSRFDVVLISANIPPSKLSGAGWDTFGGLSDVFAYVYALDPVTDESWFESSSIRDETLTPEWNETILTDVTSAALADGLGFEFWDFDAAFDDEICVMIIEVEPAMMNGQVIETTCEDDPEMKFRWKLQ